MIPPLTCHGSGSEYQPSTGCGSGAALVSGLRPRIFLVVAKVF